MAAVTPDTGHGTTVTFGSHSSPAEQFTQRILSLGWTGISRAAVPTTTFDTAAGGKTFIPSDTYDPGELSITMLFDTDAVVPLTNAAETVTITWPDGETSSVSGFLTGFEISAEDEEAMSATATIKCSGNITF